MPAAHLDWIGKLAAQRFDGAVIFTCYSQSALPAALLCQLAGIPLRAAYCREKPYQLLTDWIADPEPGAMVRHEVQRQLDLVRRLGAEVADERLSFVPTEEDMAAVRARLRLAGIDPSQRWLALHPGASAPARRYPQRHWSTLVRDLSVRIGCPLVLTGGVHEMTLIDAIALPPGARVVSMAGQLSIGELGALLAQASLVVSNNTGPAHIAAAVGTPLVDLYALTNPQHTPWRVPSRVLNHDVACRNCHRSVCPEMHHDCMEKLAPAEVVDAICSLLKQTERYRTREVALD
jgi:lipopolysaccharide heptosyltransferase II